MSHGGMMADILAQPDSLAGVIGRQLGEGRAALSEAAAILRRAPVALVTGMGSSYFAGLALSCSLRARGKWTLPAESSEFLHYPQPLPEGAVAVLISRSGESVEVVRLLTRLRAAGVRVIGVTNIAASTLAREADVAIVAGSRADRMVAVQTYTGAVATLLLLAEAVCGGMEPVDGSVFSRMAGAIDGAVEAAGAWAAFLEGAPVVYLLGRGASLASAKEGALLFHESARFPAIAMSAGYFRHGPVEVVSRDFRAIVFAGDAATRELNLALAADLRSIGGCVMVVEPEVARFAPAFEVLPVQVAACRFAERRGISPGDFRFASEVTTAEFGLK